MSFRYALTGLAFVVAIAVTGCGKDDPVTPPVGGETRIDMTFITNSQFTYTRTMLDTSNQVVPGSQSQYIIELKGSGGTIIGAYDDWYRRVGTDMTTLKKDTLFIRASPGAKEGTSFTKDVMVYGFVYKLLNTFIDQVQAAIPTAARPVIPGPQWDVIARYHEQDGSEVKTGTSWTLGEANGTQLNFTIPGFPTPITITVTTKGTLDARGVDMAVGSKTVKTWKSTVTATASLFAQNTDVKIAFWFSDNPSGQIKVEQEGTKFIVPLVNISLPLPGERQELQSWK